MRLLETLQDETGSYSFARIQATATCLMVMGLASYLTVKAGAMVPIPESWLTLLGISMGGYLGSKGISSVTTPKPTVNSVETSATSTVITASPPDA